ncbi:MAG: hypothetical protein H3C59_02275 [Burkholderiaceae bacterium]|nr:hypothetical protein [Burkholderiaceae bacterium]
MSIRASQHGDNARRPVSTIFLAFLRNRESRNQFLYACVQAAAPIALVVGLVMAGAELRESALLATASPAQTGTAVAVSSAVP